MVFCLRGGSLDDTHQTVILHLAEEIKVLASRLAHATTGTLQDDAVEIYALIDALLHTGSESEIVFPSPPPVGVARDALKREKIQNITDKLREAVKPYRGHPNNSLAHSAATEGSDDEGDGTAQIVLSDTQWHNYNIGKKILVPYPQLVGKAGKSKKENYVSYEIVLTDTQLVKYQGILDKGKGSLSLAQ